MLRQTILRRQWLVDQHLYKRATRRSTTTQPPPPSSIARLEARLPRFLQHIVKPLRNAPISHITAFLILHEITAIAPIIGLAATFHYANWLPPYISEGKWVHEGMQKYGNWMRKRGWITDEKSSGKWWGRSEGGVRIVAEVATAYAVTKLLLPVRLVVSVWGTPWFARWTVLPATGFVKRLFTRKKGAVAVGSKSGAAGTGAVAAGAVPKDAAGKVK